MEGAVKAYTIKEIFYSIQGEGVRAGMPAVFVRFAGCNLRCNVAEHGFDCDTDFASGERMTASEVFDAVKHASNGCANVIFTGGEPALQLDERLVAPFSVDSSRPWYLAVETNGTKPLNAHVDWVCCSPKTPLDGLALQWANEAKYVLRAGMDVPSEILPATHHLVSPAFHPGNAEISRENLDWCIHFCLRYPWWRLSVQQHKQWGVR
jgi:7-carboxy-7-deazaguanine synthase